MGIQVLVEFIRSQIAQNVLGRGPAAEAVGQVPHHRIDDLLAPTIPDTHIQQDSLMVSSRSFGMLQDPEGGGWKEIELSNWANPDSQSLG